jgi:hypothetical protein
MNAKAFFNWGGKDESAPPLDAGAAGAGASSQAAPDAGGVAGFQMGASADAAKTAAAASTRKRRGSREDGNARGGDSRALQAQIEGAIASQLDALHDPEAWGALLALPGDAIHAVTGRERWEVRKEERRTLGVTGSAFARTLMITNPRALAALMLGAALFSCYGTRALAELKEYREKKNAPEKTDASKAA